MRPDRSRVPFGGLASTRKTPKGACVVVPIDGTFGGWAIALAIFSLLLRARREVAWLLLGIIAISLAKKDDLPAIVESIFRRLNRK
ncbi:hypothetical protein [Paractinoplanes atraurantiacus]|uniref:Uncharacterized protein n=1 Tax=Paractinoplanes atraurantiacus TaxID=1036182 RepID=A0A285HDV1_9ACTN|nr:hypothetical protein [Actinoplanes atraurantiacus]SNY33908.1 hypothetical protein SAMN05421748_104203 [Actinoplanes atraurantiacus]